MAGPLRQPDAAHLGYSQAAGREDGVGDREIHYSEWEGKTHAEAREAHPEAYWRWRTEPAWNAPRWRNRCANCQPRPAGCGGDIVSSDSSPQPAGHSPGPLPGSHRGFGCLGQRGQVRSLWAPAGKLGGTRLSGA
ncbi:histidine phosphatase family protein [Synechococcus sp. H60.3]|uniref:histidine phosphatase family protein n=1 Tax=Synechococcus sp. H60.3 TaxID=2967124 RepID=UPI0039C06CC1